MTKTMLRKYARAIVRVGANVQKGQPVVIRAAVDQADLVAYLTEEAYRAGARRVQVDWMFDKLTKLHYRHQKMKELCAVPTWQIEKIRQQSEELPCFIAITSEDPDGLRGIDQKKMQASRRARYAATREFDDAMENRYQWVVAAAASPAWAKKVFPGERTSVAVNKLWDAILAASHVTADNDPVADWRAFDETFIERCRVLNGYHFDHLTYYSSNGTDFTVGLVKNILWEGGGEIPLGSDVYFNPNMPTEEIFTAPDRLRAEGTLVSTKPLSCRGELIENFRIRFHEGRAVEWHAEKGEEVLEKLITTDEGSAMLGELALVPIESPISQSGILFYNTLFDENASCHVALGSAYTNLLPGYENMSREELTAAGMNDSMTHVDFMIGAPDLEITGYTEDGNAVAIFKNGTWAF